MAGPPDIATGLFLPAFIERAKTQTLTMDLWRFGGIAAPTSGTITIWDESDSKVVDGASVTLTDDQITYQITAATVPATLNLSDQWRIEWAIVVDGVTETIDQEAHLVRQSLYPVVSDVHLRRRHSALTVDMLPADKASYQDYLDDAWEDIQVMLLAEGKRPYLVLSPWSLKKLHIELALSRIFRDLSTFTQAGGKYSELAAHYDEASSETWDSLTLDYDYDEDGRLSDEDEEQVSADSVVYLTGQQPERDDLTLWDV